jgi:putative holliday junction resolvase
VAEQISPGRILAIDFGMSRFGLAVSDALGLTAQGLATLERHSKDSSLSAILHVIAEYDVREVIVGNPLSASGNETAMSRRAQRFAEKLRRRVRCNVRMWDERLSSAEANRLLRASGVGIEKRRLAVDRIAATLILQNYLDWLAGQKVAKDGGQ